MTYKLIKKYPEPGRLIEALSQIGYDLEDALSDLIDNAINANATEILIRFWHDGESLNSISIKDNGCGMNAPELANAMTFGSKEDLRETSLGKFGMGLKLASLSHCECFSVISKKGNRLNALKWDSRNIAAGWFCEKEETISVRNFLQEKFNDSPLEKGTLVHWENLVNFPDHKRGVRSALGIIERKLKYHLGLVFHRFIEAGKLKIYMDQQKEGANIHPHRVCLSALNPFAYPESGHPDFPKKFRSGKLSNGEVISMEAHIWPPKSDADEYKLGKRAASHQGFYIYRNGRLIQQGGWNGLVADDSEPHSSLARVCIDLPRKFDALFKLNVQKSAVITPLGFQEAVNEATSISGMKFDDYRRIAIETYRKHSASDELRNYSMGSDFPSAISKYSDEGHPLEIIIKRSELPISYDKDSHSLILSRDFANDYYFKKDMHCRLFFFMLYELLKQEKSKVKLSHQKAEVLEKINEIIIKNTNL